MNVTYPGPHDAVEFAVVVDGRNKIETVARGETVDLPEDFARQLVAQGWIATGRKAKPAPDAPAPAAPFP